MLDVAPHAIGRTATTARTAIAGRIVATIFATAGSASTETVGRFSAIFARVAAVGGHAYQGRSFATPIQSKDANPLHAGRSNGLP